MGNLQVSAAATYRLYVPPGDVEPDQLHDPQRARVDVQHTAPTRGACLCIQHDRARHRRLDDNAPGDAELGVEEVGAGVKDNAANDGCVGECTDQARAGAHHSLQLTAVVGQGCLRRYPNRWRRWN
jgi:hypothetical protein